ncbi:MAG: hypothetical protein FWD27_04040 [Coriobacteriia bacterium]|nr:hypothetical protein [Coriobacteriia bacterium]
MKYVRVSNSDLKKLSVAAMSLLLCVSLIPFTQYQAAWAYELAFTTGETQLTEPAEDTNQAEVPSISDDPLQDAADTDEAGEASADEDEGASDTFGATGTDEEDVASSEMNEAQRAKDTSGATEVEKTPVNDPQATRPSDSQRLSVATENSSQNSHKPSSASAEEGIQPLSLGQEYIAPLALPTLRYQAHVQSVGWQTWVERNKLAGTTGRSLRLEGIKVEVDRMRGGVSYRTHVQSIGWQGWVKDGSIAGTTGRSLRIEAIQIKLTGDLASQYDIYYRTHVASYGWLGWASNGEPAGTSTFGLRMEALEIRLLAKGQPFGGFSESKTAFHSKILTYQSHVQGIGWQARVADRATSGTTGQARRVEALRINLDHPTYDGSILYRARCAGIGWQDWSRDGRMTGTTGQSRAMEAIEIKLSDGSAIANSFDIYYRVHMSGRGWLSWAKNGQTAGAIGLSGRIEAIQIILVSNGGIPGRGAAPGSTATPCLTISYSAQAEVAQTGWLPKAMGRSVIGTVGQSLAMQAFKLKIENSGGLSGSIQYSAHVSTDGWQGWVSSDSVAGIENGKKQIEAIRIRLTGELASQYDVYYRAHCQNMGWMGWARNGANAGTATIGLRLEAFELAFTLKGASAPGSTSGAYRESVSILSALNSASGIRSISTFGGFTLSQGTRNQLQGAVSSVQSRGYSVGFIMVDLRTGRGVAFNPDQVFYGASTVKGPYVASVAALVPSSVASWRSTMESSVRHSSNEGYSALRRAFGADPMRTWCSQAGVPTSIADYDYAHYSTRNLAKLWLRTYTYFESSAINSSIAQSWFTSSNNSVIRYNYGDSFYVNTKAGWIGMNGLRSASDAGVVWAHGRPYLVAIMSDSPGNMRVLDSLVIAIHTAHKEMR